MMINNKIMEKFFIRVPGTELYIHASHDALPILQLSEGTEGALQIEEHQFEKQQLQQQLKFIYQGKMELVKVL